MATVVNHAVVNGA